MGSIGERLRRLVGLATAVCLAAAFGARAHPPPTVAFPLNELVEVLVVDREMLAFDGVGTKTFREKLKIDEVVLFHGERGAVGVVLTNRRALAVTSTSSEWQEALWRLDERIPKAPRLGDRLALLDTSKRVLAFSTGEGAWAEEEIGPNETVVDVRAGPNCGVVVTSRRALGVSPLASRFFEMRLRVHEDVRDVSADSNLATITTSQRVLVFRSASGTWSERKRRPR